MAANTNNVTLKSVKGSALTHTEMDANFQEVKNVIEDLQEVGLALGDISAALDTINGEVI
jgi:hypothetical protein